MLFQMIKKELLMFWRRPRELITLLLMPFILISILGTALGAINNGKTPDLHLKLAIINYDNPDLGAEETIKGIETANLPAQSKMAAIEGVKSFNPINILINDVLKSNELKDNLKVKVFDQELSHKEQTEYSGVLIIPENFTEQFYQHAFFQDGKAPKLDLKLNNSKSLEAGFLKDFIISFQREVSLFSTVNTLGIDSRQLQGTLKNEIGKLATVTDRKPINSVTYYAIGMSVMFIFYVASNAASLAYEQKDNQIYGRILLANVPTSLFFTGIFVSTVIVAFLQMNILFGLSSITFDVRWPSLMTYLVVTLLLCLMVGGFSVFISAVSYRVNSDSISRQFSSFLVPILAFLGGSFFPVSQLGGLFEKVSNFSPGGAGISAYFKIMQGYHLSDIQGQITAIFVTIVILVVMAIIIQPKRGEAA